MDCLGRERQLDHERRRLAGQRLDPDLAAVGLDEPAHDRQPEAGAAVAGGLGPRAVERLEDPLALGLRDARAAVDEAQQDPPADVARADGDRVAVGVPVGVLEQVREGPLSKLNVMDLGTPQSAIISAIVFNAIVIPMLVPIALRGVKYRAVGATALLRRNLLIYGVGGR